MSKVFRQGDVMLREIPALPKGLDFKPVPREDGGVVLAHGEVTGHKHQFREPESQVKMLSANDNGKQRRFLVVEGKEPAKLLHEEHTALEVPPRVYEVIQQREHTDENEPRPVLD